MNEYDVIYCDPAWKYTSGGPVGGKFCELIYQTMSIKELCMMDVNALTADNCALHMWVTGAFIQEAKNVGNAWGFKFIRLDKVWVKSTKRQKRHGTPGPHGMTDCEYILLFGRGSVCSLYREGKKRNQYTSYKIPHTGVHSEKPNFFRKQIVVRYGPNVRKLEMFARHSKPGWDVFGNQVQNSININNKTGSENMTILELAYQGIKSSNATKQTKKRKSKMNSDSKKTSGRRRSIITLIMKELRRHLTASEISAHPKCSFSTASILGGLNEMYEEGQVGKNPRQGRNAGTYWIK
ncbi:MAG: N6-adenosine-specific RNA methylase IME4 [Psychromonas sp.]|jgi:N6-adenosine-specific RNA methylase IME4